jgi:hypothetical protein
VRFIVQTLKDSSVNVGAGAARSTDPITHEDSMPYDTLTELPDA